MSDLYAFVEVDDDHNERIVGMRDGEFWQPLVTTDVDQLEQLKLIARRIAHDTNRTIRLIKFTTREELPL